MSASLVGSEMCIRDRPCGAPPRRPGGRRPQSTRRPHSAVGHAAAGRALACLLYTSDAADDM
eukprot:3026467-Alexandrium_andersonii.AAC.1